MHHLQRAALLAALYLPLYADVTLRYKAEVKFNSNLPPAITRQAMNGIDDAMPTESLQQFKGGKGTGSAFGSLFSICDFTKQETTLIDRVNKRYVTIKFQELTDQFAELMPKIPEEAKNAIVSMKPRVEAKATGRAATIQGIEAEEHLFEISIDGPAMPSGSEDLTAAPAGPMMRMVIHFWLAKASEVMRVPAIREVAGYNLFAAATMNPTASLQKMFQGMPGFDFMGTIQKELQSGTGVMLRTQMEMFMPTMAAMMKQTGGAEADPQAPFMQMTSELAEISTAPLPDSLFEVPEEYQQAPVADLIGVLASKTARPAKQNRK